MSKHLDKIEKALRDRIVSAPNGPGFKKPGSMNKKKTGYNGHKAKKKGGEMTANGFAVANKQCPICRSTDVDQKYITTEPFYQCNQCGERFKK
jgi:hypothetical protein